MALKNGVMNICTSRRLCCLSGIQLMLEAKNTNRKANNISGAQQLSSANECLPCRLNTRPCFVSVTYCKETQRKIHIQKIFLGFVTPVKILTVNSILQSLPSNYLKSLTISLDGYDKFFGLLTCMTYFLQHVIKQA